MCCWGRKLIKGDDELRLGQKKNLLFNKSDLDTHTHVSTKWKSHGGKEEAGGLWRRRRRGLWDRGSREARGGLEWIQGNSRLLLPNMLCFSRGWETDCLRWPGRAGRGQPAHPLSRTPFESHTLPWPCRHSNTLTLAFKSHSQAWSPAELWALGWSKSAYL